MNIFLKYARVGINTSPKDVVKYLYSNFEINKPQLIISVTGGAKNFKLPQKTKAAFKLGLIKAAKSTSSLIITGGTNTGVMKLVCIYF